MKLDSAESIHRPSDRSSVLSGFASMGGGLLIARAIAFLGTAILTRRLGPYGFGIVGLAIAICSYFALTVQNSVGPVGSRDVARSARVSVGMVKGVIAVRLCLAFVGISLITGIVLVLDKPSDVKTVIWLTSLTMVSQAPITDWVYKGLGRLRMVGIGLILNQCVYVGMLFFLIRTPASVVWVPAALIGGQLAAAIFLGLPLFRDSRESIDLAAGLRVLEQSKYVAASKLLTNLMRVADVLLLGLIVGESSVGLYSAAYRLCLLVLGIGVSLQTAYLPLMARASQVGLEESNRIVARAFEAAVAIALPLVAGGLMYSRGLLSMLFGADFAPGATAFSLVLIGVAFQFVHGLTANVLLVFDKTRADMRLRGLASIVNVGLNLWWIPHFGIAGAGAATLASHVVIATLSIWVCNRIGVRLISPGWWKSTLATAIMVALLFTIAHGWPLGLRIVAGGLVYILTLLALGGVPVDLRPGDHGHGRPGG